FYTGSIPVGVQTRGEVYYQWLPVDDFDPEDLPVRFTGTKLKEREIHMSKKVNRHFIEPEVAIHLALKTLAVYDHNDASSLANYFPSKEVDDIEYEISIGEDAGFITAANWRTFGGSTTSETWGGGQKARGRFMPLARNYTIDEEGALRMRNNANIMR